jgi:hypothetical protein
MVERSEENEMTAYYSKDLKSWVRLEQEADGEWCHTSGYATQEEAVGVSRPNLVLHKPLFGISGMPSFLEESDAR